MTSLCPSLVYFFMSIFGLLLHQREELRARFPGVPGDLVNYFLYVAEEVIHLHIFPLLYFLNF